MADKNKKEPTPPPLLLMPPGGGLTLNPPDQPNCLMPVVQPEPSLLDEDCEADSFVGQGPPAGPRGGGPPQAIGGKPTFFQPGAPHQGASDPFAHVGQAPHPPPPAGFPSSHSFGGSIPPPGRFPPGPPFMGDQSSGVAPAPPSSFSGPGGAAAPASGGPPAGGSANMYRQKGHKLRYAQPPAGTYASSPSDFPTPPPPHSTSFNTPPLPPSSSSPSFMTPSPAASGVPPLPPQGGSFHEAPPPGSSSFQHPSLPPPPGSSSFQHPSLPPPSVAPPSQPLVGMMVPGVGVYQPVVAHWCYMKLVEGVEVWYTFSALDSRRLDQQFLKEQSGGVAEAMTTDGGRYDVDIAAGMRRAVYWEEEPAPIQRCSWFYKREGDSRYVPYTQAQAQIMEAEYKNAVERNEWHKRIELPGKDTIVMHSPSVMVHFQATSQPDEWGNVQQKHAPQPVNDQMRPRVVKRGVDDFGTVEEGEEVEVDHLVFVLHGIGDMCDVRFRNIIECVDDFRSMSNGLIRSHFAPYAQSGHIHRVEFLPVHWHMAVHSEATGVDSRLKTITLPSTSKLRDFVNNTLMDILFYTSPAFCQVISDTVGQEMNRLFQIFLARNPTFSGEVSLVGHSLGASILFDLLMHQHGPGETMDTNGFKSDSLDDIDNSFDNTATEPSEAAGEAEEEEEEKEAAEVGEPTLEGLLQKVGLQDKMEVFQQEQMDLESLSMCSEQDLKDLGLPMGPRKKLLLVLQEEKDNKEKKKLEELEKKIRKELEKKLQLKEEKTQLEQAATVEKKSPMSISVDYICGLAGTGQPLVRYPQLEFCPTSLFALGSPIGVFLSARGVLQMGETFKLPTCPKFFNIFHPLDPVAYRLEPLISPPMSSVKPVLVPHYKGRKRMHLELKESITRMGTDLKQKIVESLRSTWNSLNDFARAHRSPDPDPNAVGAEVNGQGLEKEVDQQVESVMAQMVQQQEIDKSDTASVCSSHDDEVPIGQLNEGRRIDYVLQEKPIESFNDYLFALASHGCYWTSEDTVLLILKEIYSPLGITPIMPGPEGFAPNPAMPPPMGGPPRPLMSYSAADNNGQSTAHPFSPAPFPPPPSGPLQSPPFQPLGMGSSGGFSSPPPPGPDPRFAHAYAAAPGYQGGSRDSTPPMSMGMPGSNQGFRPGPPPMAGFVRPAPTQQQQH